MLLEQLLLQNFRSYTEREFEFSPDVTVITGENGIGKTNILEAIYVVLQGRSFRDTDEQLLQYGADWWKIRTRGGDDERELRYQPAVSVSKQLLINGTNKGRFTYKHQIPVVLFEPDTLLLLHGSPGMRRAYLDTLLTTLIPSYRQSLAKYERALLQRNNILKTGGSASSLKDRVFVWDIALSEYGSQLQEAREMLVTKLNQRLSELYSLLATKETNLAVVYEPTTKHGSQGLAQALNKSLEKDALRGFTGVGPHRDDITFVLSGKDAKTTASRGEVRTIILALKYLEIELIQEATGHTPLFLLDDVFSELDTSRQKALLKHTEGVQKIITSTQAPRQKNIISL